MSSNKKERFLARTELDSILRPKTWEQYIGQKHVKDNLKIALDAAVLRNELPEHFLFYGPPGVGKTTLAYVIANTLGRPIRVTSGVAIERAADLATILTNLEPGEVLFIDEIHQLSKKVEELLYPALEAGRLDIVLGKGPTARTVELSLEPFLLIGATTKMASLSSPLRSRFGGGVFQLELYEDNDISKILKESAKKIGFTVDDEVLTEIAKRSRKTPRTANSIVKKFRDYCEVHKKKPSKELFEEACELFGIDAKGLTKDDRNYLKKLINMFGGGPTGVRTLAAALHEDSSTIEDLYEPFLINLGFIERTNRGRLATNNGIEHINKK